MHHTVPLRTHTDLLSIKNVQELRRFLYGRLQVWPHIQLKSIEKNETNFLWKNYCCFYYYLDNDVNRWIRYNQTFKIDNSDKKKNVKIIPMQLNLFLIYKHVIFSIIRYESNSKTEKLDKEHKISKDVGLS